MAPSLLDKDEADRKFLEDKLNFLEQALISHNTVPLTLHQVDKFLQQVEETEKALEANQNQMRRHAAPGADMATYTQVFFQLASMASRLSNGFHGIKISFPPTPTAAANAGSSAASATSPHQTIKLPRLDLKKFSGNLQEWISFRDTFTTAIHKSKLSNVEKLTHLKSLLTGEAERQVRSLILSDANYDIAWKALHERYENNRELLFSILRRLITQQQLNSSSTQGIRNLIDNTKECIRSLEILSIPTQHWDAVLLYLLFSKLDPSSRELWEQSLVDTSIPPLSKMFEFLEQRARALAASNVPAQRPQQKQQQPAVKSHHVAASPNCKFGCSSPHTYWKCETFKSQGQQQRRDTVKRLNLCFNCLNDQHTAASCPSKSTCKVCNRKHHTMLHLEDNNRQFSSAHDSSQQPPVTTHHIYQTGELHTGILATARVNVINESSKFPHRILVDPGSTNSYITETAAKQMRLRLLPCDIPMSGLSSSSIGRAKYVTTFTFAPHFKSMNSFSATALVVKSISNFIPSERFKKEDWHHLQGLELADPDFHIPAECTILLGTEVSWSILENEKITGLVGQPYAVKSSLGWLVAGPNSTGSSVKVFNAVADLDYHLRRFWEQETVSEESTMTSEERACENHFLATRSRDSTGRFMVSLPLKLQPEKALGSSRQAAIKRFLSMERRFNNPNSKDAEQLRKLKLQWSQYKEFMGEYLNLGHMSLIPANEVHCSKPTYYIPHHSVLKESSTTTKLRVVFDGSAASSSGKSLNQCLMVGPTLQDNLTDIMLRFRMHPIAFMADIAKMYRQIRVTTDDADLQRIVWRDDPSQPFQDYRLLTVTYGTAPAPYLAVKCLQQLAIDERERFPEAASIVLSDFYVDDAATGSDNLENAKVIVQQLRDLCMSGGFDLRKWTSNSKELLQFIPENLREKNAVVDLDQDDSTVKTLGVCWNTIEDKYAFKINLTPDMPGNYTKRTILSDIAKIYDPLGWLAPAVIVCKIFMQDLWKHQLEWDDILPENIQERWLAIKSSLKDLEKIQISRCVFTCSPKKVMLVGCCDASIKAISASVYICCEYNNQPESCRLLTSKTKVAPVKHVTLPRLELNGAVLLSELMKSVMKALKRTFDSVQAYTDSMIVLHWIQANPIRWKPYVRRRVQAVQDNIPAVTWYHISGERNPADCASRGVTAAELKDHPLWWNGTPEFFNPTSTTTDLLGDELEQLEAENHSVAVHHVQPQPLLPAFTNFSSFQRLTRVIAYVLRFANNAKKSTVSLSGWLSSNELSNAHDCILRQLQLSYFPTEIQLLKKGSSLPSTNHLLNLQPFIAEDGLLRVGGRLRHAKIPFGRKHPILLPKGNYITSCIIRDIHRKLLHAGPTSTLACLQQRYWLTNGRDSVRFVLKKCVTCARNKADLQKQVMGDLPSFRCNPSRPFSKVGVDYAGPIIIRPMVRSKVTLKCWLAVFVCFVTRAIHIEVVSSMTTECFLAALRRFTHRRGKPTDIFSDCGTNFKGTEKVLSDFIKLSQEAAVQDECASQSIVWHFNPAGAPHFGGLWEAGVKSIKYHLKRVMGSSALTYEEMLTLVVQIEGILNSRPLVPASSDPSDLEVLTPAHFLIGSAITALPEPSLIDTKGGYLKRWQLIQQQHQLFWKRWSNEFITRLQHRPKWLKPSPNVELDQMVIIKDERLPPLKWRMGRVIAVHPGQDGHVRVVTLRTAEGQMKRPIVKLCVLPTH